MQPGIRKRAALTVAAAAVLFAGCGSDPAETVTATSGPGAPGSTGPAKLPAGSEPAVGNGRGGIALVKLGDFSQPLYVTEAPGSDDAYVVEKEGTVRVVRDGKTLDRPFLDLSGDVSTESEQGLLSIAFDPEFAATGLVYAYYTARDGSQRVAAFSAGSDTADPGTRREILRMDDFAANHNGGLLQFGPDGLLYIGTGDGGLAGDPERTAQDTGSLLGKILRIDPRPGDDPPYAIPAGNPFANGGGAPEVYALGLRNPWRYSFDLKTGDLAIGDVGQNTFEEVDFVRRGKGAGANFGWSAFEATDRFNEDQSAPGAIDPVLKYGRDAGCSVTGGYVVRDRDLPSVYGRYLYGDYCEGDLRSAVLSPDGARGDRSTGLSVPQLSSFGQGSGGRLYVSSIEGPVYRVAPE